MGFVVAKLWLGAVGEGWDNRAVSNRGRLVLAGTPIGNIGDATPRLRDALASAEVIAAEDTRKLRKLLSLLGVESTAKVVSYYDVNEQQRVPELLEALAEGKLVVVVSDAGMPTVSDPGFRIAQAAALAGAEVSALPGPSAVTMALAMSGLPTDRFCFEGFLPRKAGERRSHLESLRGEKRTMVFFEATHRIGATTAAMAEAFGADRPAALCRELTKTFEEVIRGTLGEIAERCQQEVLGEITLVVQGELERVGVEDAQLLAEVNTRVAAGQDRKEAIAEVAAAHHVPKRRVFDLVVAAKR